MERLSVFAVRVSEVNFEFDLDADQNTIFEKVENLTLEHQNAVEIFLFSGAHNV